jgi:Helix-turn-helix domain
MDEDQKITNEINPRVILEGQTFTILPDWIRDSDHLSDRAIHLWCVLYGYADRTSGEAWPWRSTLADRLRCSTDSVDRAITELVKIKALEVVHRRLPNGTQGGNLYRLLSGKVDGRTGAEGDYEHGCGGDMSTGAERDMSTGAEQKNKNQLEPKPVNKKSLAQDSEAIRLCELLAELIEQNGSKKPVVTASWISIMDRIIRIDNRSPEQVRSAIDWCQKDDFWCMNILSPTSLRKHFDRMRLQAKRQRNTQGGKGLDGVREYIQEAGL